MTNLEKTQKIIDSQSWVELKEAINKHAPFISYSRSTPKEWSAETLIRNMELIRAGAPLNLVTRANGIRAKVAEFLYTDNYGDPWE